MRSQKDGWKWRRGGAAGRQKSGLFVLQMKDTHMCQALEFHLNCGDSDRTVNQVTTATHFKRLMKRWLRCPFRSFQRDSAPCLPCGQHCHRAVGLCLSGHLIRLCCSSGSLKCPWACLPFRLQVCETAQCDNSDDSDVTELAEAGQGKEGKDAGGLSSTHCVQCNGDSRRQAHRDEGETCTR